MHGELNRPKKYDSVRERQVKINKFQPHVGKCMIFIDLWYKGSQMENVGSQMETRRISTVSTLVLQIPHVLHAGINSKQLELRETIKWLYTKGRSHTSSRNVRKPSRMNRIASDAKHRTMTFLAISHTICYLIIGKCLVFLSLAIHDWLLYVCVEEVFEIKKCWKTSRMCRMQYD